MQKTLLFLDWFFLRPWHFWIPLILIILVFAAAKYWKSQSGNIYRVSSVLMQLIGLSILLYLLNQNIFIIKNTTFVKEVQKWAIENPLNRRDAVVKLDGSSAYVGVGAVSGDVKITGRTLEERLSVLEKEFDNFKEKIEIEKSKLYQVINNNKADTDSRIEKINEKYSNVNKVIEKVVLGDYRFALFSTFMIIGGLLLSLFPIRNGSKRETHGEDLQ